MKKKKKNEQGKSYEELAAQIEKAVPTGCKDPNAFAVIVEGDSMSPHYLAGDTVVFAPNEEHRNGRAVIAKHNDGRLFFKVYHRTGTEGSRIRLESINPNYAPVEFGENEFTFIYPAFELIRDVR